MSRKESKILIGCVADDFTGAGDAASFLVENGIKTILFNGVPGDENLAMDCTAVIIALKTRNIDPKDAVTDTLEAFHWLEEHGAEQFYIKYCSTFDSTPEGNIGPTVDAVMETFGEKYTVLCPSLPVNKRTVRDGRLFVDGLPLDESPMRKHPLNPMWDSHIEKLMESQGKYPTLVIDERILAGTPAEIFAYIEEFGRDKEHFYVVPDYETDEQGRKIVEVFGKLKLLTGGAGLLTHIAEKIRMRQNSDMREVEDTGVPGKGVILSGSCSKATRNQISCFRENGKSLALYPEKLLSGEMNVEIIWKFIQENAGEEVLIYCDGHIQEGSVSKEEQERNSRILEKTIAEISKKVYDNGYTRIVVAGGETSGAVVLALGFEAFLIGKSIAPGVPVMIPLQKSDMRLVLKSGNFGQDDFFRRALDMTRRE